MMIGRVGLGLEGKDVVRFLWQVASAVFACILLVNVNGEGGR